MSNLIRGRQDFLFNTLSTKDFGMYYEGGVATGRPHLVIKEPGIDIPAGTVDVKVLEAVTGTKQKKTLSIAWLWDGRGSKVFEIEITRQPLYSGFGHEQFPVSKSYQYKIPAFVTNTTGTLHNTDKETIVNGLVAAINADVQLNRNVARAENLDLLVLANRALGHEVGDGDIAAGFGISSPEHVRMLDGLADVAVIGSHIINLLDSKGMTAVDEFLAACGK